MLQGVGCIIALKFDYISHNQILVNCIKNGTNYGMYLTMRLFTYYVINVFKTIGTQYANVVRLRHRMKIQHWDDKKILSLLKFKWFVFISIWIISLIGAIFVSMYEIGYHYNYTALRLLKAFCSLIFMLIEPCSCVYVVYRFFKLRSTIGTGSKVTTLTLTLYLYICVVNMFVLDSVLEAIYTIYDIAWRHPPIIIAVLKYSISSGYGIFLASLYMLFKILSIYAKRNEYNDMLFASSNWKDNNICSNQQYVSTFEPQPVAPSKKINGESSQALTDDTNAAVARTITTQSNTMDYLIDVTETYSTGDNGNCNNEQLHPTIEPSTTNTRDDVLENN